MKITRVEVLPIDRYLYVQIHTDAGIVGLGESGTHTHQEAAEAAPHEPAAATESRLDVFAAAATGPASAG